jgi:hypothetical protein
MRNFARRNLVCGTLALLACSEESTGPRPVPTAIAIVAGAAQKGTVGQVLDSAIAVFVTDKFGDPVPGVLVRFSVPARNGGVVPVAQTTGPGGHASARWSLPTATGTYRAYATASGLDSLVFQAAATAAPPALLKVVAGDLQTGIAETAADSAVVVLVQDEYGNPVSGAAVSFVPGAGAGTANPATARSDSLGYARTVWTLGARGDGLALTVRLDSLHQIRVRARALHPPALNIAASREYSGAGVWEGGQWSGRFDGGRSTYESRLPLPALGCWHNALGPVPILGPDAVDGTTIEATRPGLPGCGGDPEKF